MTDDENAKKLAELFKIDVEIITELGKNGGVMTDKLWNQLADCYNREHGGNNECPTKTPPSTTTANTNATTGEPAHTSPADAAEKSPTTQPKDTTGDGAPSQKA